jgi:hypothetical protein
VRGLALVGFALLLALLVGPASAQADTEVPGGRFFTEALPEDPDGGGFAVQDGHGVRLWSAFQAHGGVATLGYPISRRFELDGGVAQAFQYGVLRWNADAEQFDLVEGRTPPREAVVSDQPPRAIGEAETRPWSGWWWPASDGIGPTLFAANGPLEKYDQYVAAVTGENPGTRAWEREQLYFPGNLWAGHCNGFAAAALLEPEPTEPREILGISFSIGDLKALLVDYHFADAAGWAFPEAEGVDLEPSDFHRMLLDWLQVGGKGFVITFDMGGGEVWSYPAYRFESEWAMDPDVPGVWRVKTTVWMADMEVPTNFVGLKPFPGPGGKTFEYTLDGDPREPSGGAWTGASRQGRFAHPGRIWYPEPLVRNLDRELVSPALDRETVANIIAGSDGSPAAELLSFLRL